MPEIESIPAGQEPEPEEVEVTAYSSEEEPAGRDVVCPIWSID